MEKYDWEQFCNDRNCPFWGTDQCCVDYCEGERSWEIDFYDDDEAEDMDFDELRDRGYSPEDIWKMAGL